MAAQHPFADRWNHNTHYYPLVTGLLSDDARVVLDVGCGDGSFARFADRTGRTVIGADVTEALLPRPDAGSPIFIVGSADVLPLGTGSVDAVSMLMVLHHVDPVAALAEARRVLKPGGLLAILGFARSTSLSDLPTELRDVAAHRWHRRGKRAWDPPTAKAQPTSSWQENRRMLVHELPGCTYRRLPMWRYLVTWRA